jgi:hypothetical protein
MQASPGFWSPWVDSWRSCEGSMGVREVRGSPAARNRKGGAGYRRRSSGSIPARQGSGLRAEASGSFLVARRSYCGSWPELGCTGATGARRRRGSVQQSRTGQRH